MQASEITSVVQSIVEWLVNKGALPTLFLIAIMLWAVGRTGSSHLLTSRLWHLVLGKHKPKSSSMSEFFQQRDELMRLRLQTGLKRIGTHAQAERLLVWITKHDVDIDLVRRCGGHFDLQKPGLRDRLPGPLIRFAMLMAGAVFFYLVMAQVAFMVSTPPLLKVVKSERWYGVTKDEAFHFEFNRRSARFGVKDCTNIQATAGAAGYPADDVSTICELWRGGEAPALLNSAERTQWIGLSLGSAVALLFCGVLLQGHRQSENAIRLKKLLETRTESEKLESAEANAEAEVVRIARRAKATSRSEATRSEAPTDP